MTIKELPTGDNYIDNGGETFIKTDIETRIDGYFYCVEMTGEYKGKGRLVREDIKLVIDAQFWNGMPFVCAIANGWSKKVHQTAKLS